MWAYLTHGDRRNPDFHGDEPTGFKVSSSTEDALRERIILRPVNTGDILKKLSYYSQA